MKIVIHDLKEDIFKEILPDKPQDIRLISDDGTMRNCIGCFGCWTKTPGACVIRDNYGDMGEYLSKCDEVIIISKCFYGGYSPFVKKVLDRSISYVLPDFRIINGEMHHKTRYSNSYNLKVLFYGEDITEQEKQTAEKLVKANAINLDSKNKKVIFFQSVSELKGCI